MTVWWAGFPPMRPLILASNRLPLTLERGERGIEVRRSSGGLVSALANVGMERRWIGWPGTEVPPEETTAVRALLAEGGFVPVFLDAEQERRFYRDVCNEAMWPILHSMPVRMRFDVRSWQVYVEVNRAFAAAILDQCGDDARVWIHDYHLLLVPAMLREQRPRLEIGFFLHTPFPSSEIFRVLPAREEVLRGVLGADAISFHTSDYARHFRSACLRVLGIDSEPDVIEHEGRRIAIGVDPIGIDVQGFEAALADPACAEHAAAFAAHYAGRRLLLGVERLDYSKGVPQKLRAFERYLERDPTRVTDTILLQITVPSRLENEEYRELKSEIEEEVGRINGRFGQPGRVPVEYLHRSVPMPELAALYRTAAAALVLPLRDGMNLVAQEFVYCQAWRPDGEDSCRGALVLSEFAGAAHVLPHALLVNPHDFEATADTIGRALALPRAARRHRLLTMAERVTELDSRRWTQRVLERLDRAARASAGSEPSTPLDQSAMRQVEQAFGPAPHRILFLDYDGTLREITAHPDFAQPTDEILLLLNSLAALPETEVHLVSGRRQDTMEAWFGDLHIWLCAEHGLAIRSPGGTFETRTDVDISWIARVRPLLEAVTEQVPGSLLETKATGLAWHYRMVDFDSAQWRARELLTTLEQYLRGAAAEIVPGRRLIEVRAKGVDKGAYVRNAIAAAPQGTFLLAAGDDRTDIDMYKALPPEAFTIHAGSGFMVGGFRFLAQSPARVRALLRRLIEAGRRR